MAMSYLEAEAKKRASNVSVPSSTKVTTQFIRPEIISVPGGLGAAKNEARWSAYQKGEIKKDQEESSEEEAQTQGFTKAGTGSTGAASVDTVAALLQALATGGNTYKTYDEASAQAAAELGPQYANAGTQLRGALDLDMEKRGIYNSPLASGIMTEKSGQLANEQISAIASRASEIIQNDRTLTLQEKQLQSDTLNKLLSSLIGRETSVAELTGVYNGQPTLASQQLTAQTKIAEAGLTGTYNGQQTLEAQQANINTVMTQVEMMGYVATQEQADILGVPVGTPTAQAKQAAASLQASINAQNQSASNDAANKSLAAFNKDMTVWQATGVAPDTPAMRYYGIAPGTPWNSQAGMTAQDKLQELQAQEELDFYNKSTKYMSTYGVDRNTAEALTLITQQAKDYGSASTIVNTQSAALAAEGISVSSLLSALDKYYKQQTLSANGGWTKTGDTSSWQLKDVNTNTSTWLDKVANGQDSYQGPGYFGVVNGYNVPQIWVKVNGKWYERWA